MNTSSSASNEVINLKKANQILLEQIADLESELEVSNKQYEELALENEALAS